MLLSCLLTKHRSALLDHQRPLWLLSTCQLLINAAQTSNCHHSASAAKLDVTVALVICVVLIMHAAVHGITYLHRSVVLPATLLALALPGTLYGRLLDVVCS